MKKYVFQEYLNMIGENIVNTKLKPGISGADKRIFAGVLASSWEF